MLTSFIKINDRSMLTKIQASLNLLNEYALKADFRVATLVDQKLINKNDVNPINSQPKNNTKKLPLLTNNNILITNKFINKINLSTFESVRKYENVYTYTNKAIVEVNKIKLYDILSI